MVMTAAQTGEPYGASLAISTWPGGTSAISAWTSAGDHHEVSKNRFGCSGASRQIQERSEMPGVGEDEPQAGVAAGGLDGVPAERGDPAAGVHEHRQAALVGEREHPRQARDGRARTARRADAA